MVQPKLLELLVLLFFGILVVCLKQVFHGACESYL